MTDTTTRRQRLEQWIEAMDKPLLVLALLSMGLYLLELHVGLTGWARVVALVPTLLIDFVFVFDLALKLTALGKSYVQTPWFLIDLLSCLPLFDVLVNGVLPLRAIRFIRVFRMLRILRGLRVLRVLRTIPAFEQFVNETPESESETGRKFHRSITIAMLSLTAIVLVTVVGVRKKLEGEHVEQLDAAILDSRGDDVMKRFKGKLEPPRDLNFVKRPLVIGGRPRTVYFGLERVDDRADEIEFFLILGMMFTMLFFMYIMAYHQLDVSQTQLRALLNLALPKQVADQFMIDPKAYQTKRQMPAAILFMDFVGFTQTCEALAHDPDELSTHLERAMDRLVGALVQHDVIIDKFIGDAVMSFRGGPLVSGTLEEHAYRVVRAALESIKALEALNDPYFHRVKIGGAASDECMIGAFGTSARFSYTILGDAVNVAARLEPASGQCGTRNLFDENIQRVCADRPDLAWRRWGQVRVEGRLAPLTVYEAFDASEFSDLSFIWSFHRALDLFERNDFDRARDLFLLAHAQRPGGDPPSRGYIGWCESLLLEGPPVGWEPVFETHK